MVQTLPIYLDVLLVHIRRINTGHGSIYLYPFLFLSMHYVVQVLEHDEKNVSVLVQRALLYESMEKYKLGAEDLRTVMKLDPGNRVARSTIHRLTKMAEG